MVTQGEVLRARAPNLRVRFPDCGTLKETQVEKKFPRRIVKIIIYMAPADKCLYTWREWFAIKLFDLAQKIAGWEFDVGIKR